MRQLLVILPLIFVVAACAPTTTERLELPLLEVVESVDLGRYTGTWYELASYPQSFQEGCFATTATYTLRADGEIDVLNRCRKGSLQGEIDEAHGRARVVDTQTNSKLEIRAKGYSLDRLKDPVLVGKRVVLAFCSDSREDGSSLE